MEEKKSRKPKLNKKFLYSAAELVYRDENTNWRISMKTKRLISSIVIICLLNFTITPVFALTKAEAKENRQTAVLILIGSVAAVGIWFMLTRDNKNNLREVQQESTILDKLPVDVEFGLDYTNAEFYNDSIFNNLSDQSRNEFGTPTLKIKISW